MMFTFSCISRIATPFMQAAVLLLTMTMLTLSFQQPVQSYLHSPDADDEAVCSTGNSIHPSPAWVQDGGYIFLIVLVIIMFWALALVCEEYFVPALDIFCKKAEIPHDVVGATFMAAGASSPELFTAFIGLLIYDSNIGVGTVVGSEIFNHMIISAGSVLFAADGVLYLDARIVARDLIAYMLSLLLLVWSLKGSGFSGAINHALDRRLWEECLDVTLLHAVGLVLFYAVYAAVCGNFQRLTRWFCPRPVEDSDAGGGDSSIASAAAAAGERQSSDRSALTAGAPESLYGSTQQLTQQLQHGDYHAVSREEPLHGHHHSGVSVLSHSVPHLRSYAEGEEDALDVQQYSSLLDEALAVRKRRRSSAGGHSSHSRHGSATGGSMAAAAHAALALSVSSDVGDVELTGSGGISSSSGDGEAQLRLQVAELVNANFAVTDTQIANAPSAVGRLCQQLLGVADTPEIGVMRTNSTALKCYLRMYSDALQLDALPPLMLWQLRYFTIDSSAALGGIYWATHHDEAPVGPHLRVLDLAHARAVVVLDRAQLHFQLQFAEPHKPPAMLFQAPSECVLDEAVGRIEELLSAQRRMTAAERCARYQKIKEVVSQPVDENHLPTQAEELLAAPRGRYSFIWHLMTYPLKWMFTMTLVDVREAGNEGRCGYVIAMCAFYLFALSYVMILCCDYLGDFIGASPTVMGLTLSAVGTSFPNLWSSMVVARQGYGSMAISNALGSNVFNVNVALGLPWVCKVLMAGGAYREMRDHGIVLLIVLLEIVCVIWFAFIYFAGFRMFAWMSWVWVVLYFAVLIPSIVMS